MEKDSFKKYLKESESDKAYKGYVWSTAIGLQAVDGLKLLNEEKVGIGNTKVDIENEKVDIQDVKVDIESVLSEKGSDFSVKTTVHIYKLFEKFGFDEIFGRSAVMELLN